MLFFLVNQAWHFFVCKISDQLVGRLEPNLHGYNIGHNWDMIKTRLGFADLSIIHKVTAGLNRSNGGDICYL